MFKEKVYIIRVFNYLKKIWTKLSEHLKRKLKKKRNIKIKLFRTL